MLFGLPPRKREFYRPKTSGKMGGRLTIVDPLVGEYTIERLDEVQKGAARCYTTDNQEHGEEWLKDRLKGMTKDIYQSVYSFSALDLNDFKQMKDEDIGEVLLGIGLTGSNNIYKIEKKLDQKIGELFKPTGKIPVINQQLDSLDELFSQLTDYKKNEATYQEKQEQVDTIRNEIDKLQKKLQETKQTKQTIERYQSNLPIINDYHLSMKQLENYPNKIQFPENGLERLNRLKEKLLPLESELSVLEANQTKNETQQTKLKEERLDEDLYEEAQSILLKRSEYVERNRELKSAQEKVETIKVKLETALSKLNVGLTSEQLTHISLPFYIEEEWKEFKNEADRLNFEKEQLQQEHVGLEKQRIFFSDQVAKTKKDLLTTEQQNQLYSQIDAYKESDYRHKLNKETSEKQIKWEKEKTFKEKRMKSLLVGGLIIGSVIGGAGFLLDIPFLYNVMTMIVIIGIGQWIWGKRAIQDTSVLLMNHEDPHDHTILITESQKQEAEQLLMEHDENRSTILAVNDQLKSIDIKCIQLEEKCNGLEQRESKLHTQIERQLDQYPFLENIEIKYWGEFYHTIKQLLDMLQEQQIYGQQVEKVNKEIDSYAGSVMDFLKKVDQLVVKKTLDFQLEIIENIVGKYEDTKRMLDQFTNLEIENNTQQEKVIANMKIFQREINELFTIAQVDSEDEFFKKEKMKNEKQGIEESIRKTSEQLQAIFSQSIWLEISQNKPDQSKLAVDDQQTNDMIREIEESIHVRRQQLADINADLMNMESSEIYSQTMHQFTIEKGQLAKLTKEWAILKTAKEMLDETKRKYREKHLTDVLDRTSVYFKKVTMNAYESIIPPQDGRPFQVETTDHMRYQVNELSQGTIDQLYVCLRLAISEIMSEEYHLPFIIDDAFVHFDASRTKYMMEILAEIGQKQQIIMFTCKQEVINSLAGTHHVVLE